MTLKGEKRATRISSFEKSQFFSSFHFSPASTLPIAVVVDDESGQVMVLPERERDRYDYDDDGLCAVCSKSGGSTHSVLYSEVDEW